MVMSSKGFRSNKIRWYVFRTEVGYTYIHYFSSHMRSLPPYYMSTETQSVVCNFLRIWYFQVCYTRFLFIHPRAAGTDSLTCLPKHAGARDNIFLVTHPMTDQCCLTSTIARRAHWLRENLYKFLKIYNFCNTCPTTVLRYMEIFYLYIHKRHVLIT
jgi:hypothetical protein